MIDKIKKCRINLGQKDGEEKGFTASEFQEAKECGWEKQFRYYDGEKKVYYTPSEAEEKELKRVNRTPKTTPYGRKNEMVEYWNDKEAVRLDSNRTAF